MYSCQVNLSVLSWIQALFYANIMWKKSLFLGFLVKKFVLQYISYPFPLVDHQTLEDPELAESDISACDDHSSMELSDSDFELAEDAGRHGDVPRAEETPYVANATEELGQQGEMSLKFSLG